MPGDGRSLAYIRVRAALYVVASGDNFRQACALTEFELGSGYRHRRFVLGKTEFSLVAIAAHCRKTYQGWRLRNYHNCDRLRRATPSDEWKTAVLRVAQRMQAVQRL